MKYLAISHADECNKSYISGYMWLYGVICGYMGFYVVIHGYMGLYCALCLRGTVKLTGKERVEEV